MSLPLILLFGQAGSGKDTVADFMVQDHGAVTLALADPMKRLARHVFGFNQEQLWGPSSCRNAPDPRTQDPEALDWILGQFYSAETQKWLYEVLPTPTPKAEAEFRQWFMGMMEVAKTKPLTPRLVLQTLGTEFGRHQSRDTWIRIAIGSAMKLLGGGYSYVRTEGLVKDPGAANPRWVVVTDGRFLNEIVSVAAAGGRGVKIMGPDSAMTAAAKAAGVAGHASESEQGRAPDPFFSCVFWNDKSRGLGHCQDAVFRMMSEFQRTRVIA